jgi:hypothetical protein
MMRVTGGEIRLVVLELFPLGLEIKIKFRGCRFFGKGPCLFAYTDERQARREHQPFLGAANQYVYPPLIHPEVMGDQR